MTDVATIDHAPIPIVDPPQAGCLIDRVPALLMPGERTLPVPARMQRALQRTPLPRDLAQPARPTRLSDDTARRVLAVGMRNAEPADRPARAWRPDGWSVLTGSAGTILLIVILAVLA